MKRPVYECKKCGKPCNGGGVSFMVLESEDKAVLVMSTDMDELPEHGCGEEHMVQAFSDVLRKIKGEKPLETASPRKGTASEETTA